MTLEFKRIIYGFVCIFFFFFLLRALVCYPRGCERVHGYPGDIPQVCDLPHENEDLGHLAVPSLHIAPSRGTCRLSEPLEAQKPSRSSEWTDLYEIASEATKFPQLLCKLEARTPCMPVFTFRKMC